MRFPNDYYGKEISDYVVLFEKRGNNTDFLNNDSKSTECIVANKSIAAKLLTPLLLDKQVALLVEDPKRPKKSRVLVQVLYLSIVSMRSGEKKLLVSYPAYGCELIDLNKGVAVVALMRVGLSYKLSKALANELNQIFKEI